MSITDLTCPICHEPIEIEIDFEPASNGDGIYSESFMVALALDPECESGCDLTDAMQETLRTAAEAIATKEM